MKLDNAAPRIRPSEESVPRLSSREVLLPSMDEVPLPPPMPEDTHARNVREERVTCSFPGLMKVLLPEKSFVPIPMAVRVVNISSGGAQVEVHDSVKMDREQPLANRFFELKVAHPDIPELRGTIAWSDFSGKNLRLGLACFERNKKLAQIALLSETAVKLDGPPPLPPPEIDPFPPSTREETVVIQGTAHEALEVIVARDDDRKSFPVVRGRFEVKLELDPNGENQFSLRSVAGQRKSRSIPIRIDCEKKFSRRKFFFSVDLTRKRGTAEQLKVEFNGTVRQAERVLYRVSQLMAASERVSLSAELSSQSGFDKRLYETLRSEGSVLASDTTPNQAAAALLDELL